LGSFEPERVERRLQFNDLERAEKLEPLFVRARGRNARSPRNNEQDVSTSRANIIAIHVTIV
jgi:hypothetical protein